MKQDNKTLRFLSAGLLIFSALAMCSVALMALANPQSVMDLVQVQLGNTDAFSSIRGVYGGVGISLAVLMIWLAVKDRQRGLLFLVLFWGSYAGCRVLTMLVDGALGAFGRQWLLIETVLCAAAAALWLLGRRLSPKHA